MADAINSSQNEEWDLNFIYEMAKQVRSSDEIKQFIKLSERCLEEAKKINDKNMIFKFDSFHSEINEAYLKGKIDRYLKIREDLFNVLIKYDYLIENHPKRAGRSESLRISYSVGP